MALYPKGKIILSDHWPTGSMVLFRDDRAVLRFHSFAFPSNFFDNIAVGRQGEMHARVAINAEGLAIVGEQVYIRTANGDLRIVDFLVRDRSGRIAGVEVKANNGVRSARQIRLDNEIGTNGGRIVSRAPLAGLRRGGFIAFDTTVLNVTIVRK